MCTEDRPCQVTLLSWKNICFKSTEIKKKYSGFLRFLFKSASYMVSTVNKFKEHILKDYRIQILAGLHPVKCDRLTTERTQVKCDWLTTGKKNSRTKTYDANV